jgi:D-amino-acid oxidase
MTDAVVLGAGVIGLTTAICLAEGGLRVRVRTAAPPGATTSAAAGAMCGPGPRLAAVDRRTQAWRRDSAAAFTALAGDPDTGVRLADGLVATRSGALSAFLAAFADARRCRRDELPAGFAAGRRVRLPVMDMPRYLDYLQRRLRAAGGRVDVDPVRSVGEAGAPLIANCTGVAARDLVPDPQVRAVRGQHVVVANPGLSEFFVEEPTGDHWVCWFPHGGHVVLGGTAGLDDLRLEPDEAMAADIVRRCAAVEPRLADAPVLGHRVGLRPYRPTPRLDVEEEVNGARVVHCYGHAGEGVAVSWGCAREAADLLTNG